MTGEKVLTNTKEMFPENEKVSGSRREDIKATMNELQHYGLIAATVVKDDIKGKQLSNTR